MERQIHDSQEEIAMLRHRLRSISYWLAQPAAIVHYVFRSSDGRRSYILIEAERRQQLDWLLKRDPLFPYSEYRVTPVISTRALVEEIEDFLGETLLGEDALESLAPHPVHVDQNANYVMVHKRQPPFSPLLAEDIQRDIYRKTASSQSAHNPEIEISDVNPLGTSLGIHISRVDNIDAARKPVEQTAIFPDTVVEYIPLRTLLQARQDAEARLRRYGLSP